MDAFAIMKIAGHSSDRAFEKLEMWRNAARSL